MFESDGNSIKLCGEARSGARSKSWSRDDGARMEVRAGGPLVGDGDEMFSSSSVRLQEDELRVRGWRFNKNTTNRVNHTMSHDWG